MDNIGLPFGVFLSTPSARRATRKAKETIRRQIISIHALCEEGDVAKAAYKWICWAISIHALCEEGDATHDGRFLFTASFLSTPSARRATEVMAAAEVADEFLSTPSARRATLHLLHRGQLEEISIHALCEEGDV